MGVVREYESFGTVTVPPQRTVPLVGSNNPFEPQIMFMSTSGTDVFEEMRRCNPT